MKTRLVSMICGLMLFTPLVASSQFNIKGVVKGNDGNTIPGVKVVIEETYFKTYTDKEGAFLFSKIKPGEYDVVFSAIGYVDHKEHVVIDNNDESVTIWLTEDLQEIEEMIVQYVRADERTPTTYTNLDAKQIEEGNFGQDLPYLLRMTPSTVVTSDAGAGIGYTGIRIRGVDPTRTNVTINGIPLNDSESHGVFWVNMPDFSSSVDAIQVQRGVGTSSNGAAAFGASINIKTDGVNPKPYGTLDNAYGSFNTWRNTVSAGTGLIDGKFTLDARLSRISSDGYIDRASSNLKSFYLSGAWIGKKSQVRANIFSGREKTYQAWYGTPEAIINGDEDDIIAYADRNYIFGDERSNLLESGRTYNYYTYDNEVDNYGQDHYQLHFKHRFNPKLSLNLAGHYTKGAGYYEQYKAGEDFATYGFDSLLIGTDTITQTDIIRRRWLDNDFFGGVFALNYEHGDAEVTLGGGANQYNGDHFGEVVWAEYASNSDIRDRYYENSSDKFEFHTYLKGTLKKNRTTYFVDVQYRHIDYAFLGIDEVNGVLVESPQQAAYDFINPKAGFMVDINNRNNIYFSMAGANREPVRKDFRESTPENRPVYEQVIDFELGYRYKGKKLLTNANGYFMNYTDQLILTGQINDVGGYTRTNVDNSYRAGIELELGYMILKNLSITGNITLSQNKVDRFNEFVDNYDVGGQDTIAHSNTDLAFSPNVIAAAGVSYTPVKGLDVNFLSKYVGEQFLDNTSNDTRKLGAYFISNLQISYALKDVLFKEIKFGLQVNNLFNELYENNGYTWGYVYGGERTQENFYYPQAGRNFMTRITIKL